GRRRCSASGTPLIGFFYFAPLPLEEKVPSPSVRDGDRKVRKDRARPHARVDQAISNLDGLRRVAAGAHGLSPVAASQLSPAPRLFPAGYAALAGPDWPA